MNLMSKFKNVSLVFEFFFPKAVGLAFKENDLLVTKACKRAFKTKFEAGRINDFLIKTPSDVNLGIKAFKRALNEIVLSIPREKAIVRELNYPDADITELKNALQYQLDSFVPYTIDDVYYDVFKIENNDQYRRVLIIAVKKEYLDTILEKLKAIGIVPTKVIISPISLVPVISEKKGKVVTIHKLTKNYCYNTFLNGLLISTLLINEREEVNEKIRNDMPDEIMDGDNLVASMAGVKGVVNDNNTTDFKNEDTESGGNDTLLYKTVQVSEPNDMQEAFGAALYGIKDNGPRFNLFSAGKRIIHLQKILMYGFLGMLLLFLFLIPHSIKERKLAGLDLINHEINLLKEDINRIEDIRNRLTVMEDTLVNVGKLQADYSVRIKVLLELSAKLPANAWIKEFYITRNMFEIGGTALSATDLIPILENSQLFSNVGLSAPVVNTAVGEESFRIKGEINVKVANKS